MLLQGAPQVQSGSDGLDNHAQAGPGEGLRSLSSVMASTSMRRPRALFKAWWTLLGDGPTTSMPLIGTRTSSDG